MLFSDRNHNLFPLSLFLIEISSLFKYSFFFLFSFLFLCCACLFRCQERLKSLFLGDSFAGKTALAIQFVQGFFLDEWDPTPDDSYRTTKNINGTTYVLDIIDTCGREEWSAMRDHYIRQSEGFAVVYSIKDHDSFLEAETLIEQIHRVKDDESVPIVLVGNMCDLESERIVSTEEGKELAERYGIPFLETSAKTNHNVDEMFETIVSEIVEPSNPAINNDNLSPDKKGKDCAVQ